MISLEEYTNHWQKHYPQLISSIREDVEITPVMFASARSLVNQVNLLLKRATFDGVIVSGWRPKAVNALIPGAAPFSKHILMQAIDIADPEGVLDDFCMNANDTLYDLRLWFEHPAATKGWCHLQNVPYGSYKSGKSRWFYP